MRMYDIIEKKRDGYTLSREEINYFISGYSSGRIPDYQAAALLMAMFIKGLSMEETVELTEAMADSGDRIDLSDIEGTKVDKHSTGGVGDKTTLVVAPIVAACGAKVAKMAGRGLGHTGGTIDKLESIPEFKTSISIDEFKANIRKIGISISGQTGSLVPADKKLYALRDVTATVGNIALIASSIMSKKIACGADVIVLDVKAGNGALIKTFDESLNLAKVMVEIGNRLGKKTAAVITAMDRPLGNAIGNSLEVMEAIDTMKGHGPKDLKELSIEIAARMLELAGAGSLETCKIKAADALSKGKALEKFVQMIKMQGGDPRVIENYNLFGKAAIEHELVSETAGFVGQIQTALLGKASVVLGAGRERKEDEIDHNAGIILLKKPGDKVLKGDAVARLFSNDENKIQEAVYMVKKSIHISETCFDPGPIILDTILK